MRNLHGTVCKLAHSLDILAILCYRSSNAHQPLSYVKILSIEALVSAEYIYDNVTGLMRTIAF